MLLRYSDLRNKEVINLKTGSRLGYICDLVIKVREGHICAIVVPGPNRFFWIFGRDDDIEIPWDCIERIGDDLILVNFDQPPPRCPRKRPRFFGSG